MILTPKDILAVWHAGHPARHAARRRVEYYRGAQSVADLGGSRRLDGRLKTDCTTNWTCYVCQMHAGFLTARDVSYTVEDMADDRSALDEFRRLYRAQNLDALDTQHLVDAMLTGRSVEVHSYDDSGIKVSRTDPLGWQIVRDESGDAVAAIYRAELPAGTLYQGSILSAPKVLFYSYDDESVAVLEHAKNGLALVGETPHRYGRMPVVEFRVSQDGKPFFSDAFLAAADLYDVIRNSLADDIRYNVDALLATKGINLEQLLATNGDGVTVIQRLKEMGIFPLPADASAEFLTRNVDIEKFKYDIRLSRYAIHMMGCVPDLGDTVSGNGASTSISGIALKLLFQQLIQKSAEFAKHFRVGLADRVALVNRVWELQGKPQLVDYDIKLERNLPTNDIEWVQYMGNMQGILPPREIFKQLPFLDDPEATYREFMSEGMTGQKSEKTQAPAAGNAAETRT